MKKLTKRFWPILILVAVELVLLIANVKDETYLIGWDNTVPEFNLKLNLVRILNAVWQEYRGVGILDGMAHGANIMHWVYIALLSLVLPQNLVRYVFMGLAHVVGGIGMLFLLRYLTGQKNWVGAMVGAIFYMFNFGVVQVFYAPLELFVIHFAMLPWAIWVLMRYMEEGKGKWLKWFGVVNLLGVSQAHVPSIAIVYGLVLLLVFLVVPIKQGLSRLRMGVVLLGILVVVNAFWGLPYIYSTVKNAGVIAHSKINEMTTQEVFLRNNAFGDFKNVALMRSFNLDYMDYRTGGESDYMLAPWREFIDQLVVLSLSWVFFGFVVVGLVRVLWFRERRWIAVACMWLMGFLFLGSDIPVVGIFSWFLRTYIPLFEQVFRFTFTKFGVVYALGYSGLLVYGLSWLVERFGSIVRGAAVGFVLVGIVAYSWPAFQGNWFYSELKQEIPIGYFQLMSFFSDQDYSERVAVLPSPAYWGWTTNRWGHRGAGWLWQAIPHPMLDRAFDAWSQYNEQYYWELSTAVNEGDAAKLRHVWDKYAVRWVVTDRSILDTTSPKPIDPDNLHRLVSESGGKLVRQFGGLLIYRVGEETGVQRFVAAPKEWVEVASGFRFDWTDRVFEAKGDYVQDQETFSSYYPWLLFSNKAVADQEYVVTEENNALRLTAKHPIEVPGGVLTVPNLARTEKLLPVKLGIADGELQIRYLLPDLKLDGKSVLPIIEDRVAVPVDSVDRLSVNNDQVGEDGETYLLTDLPNVIRWQGGGGITREYFVPVDKFEVAAISIDGAKDMAMSIPVVENSNWSKDLLALVSSEPTSCVPYAKGSFTKMVDSGVTYSSQGNSSCESIHWPEALHDQGYVIGVDSQHISGLPAKMTIKSSSWQKAVMENFLPAENELVETWWMLPPTERFNNGYELTLDTFSLGREVAENRLEKLQAWPFPYRFLTQMKWERENHSSSSLEIIEVSHPVPSLYLVSVEGEGLLGLAQGFEDGWVANLPDHRLWNGWANSWMVPSGTTRVVIFYWPQVLEWVGLAGLVLSIMYFVLRIMRERRRKGRSFKD